TRADQIGVKLVLPEDIVVAAEFTADSAPMIVRADQIPEDMMGLDIGPNSANIFALEIKKCKTVFWNG
ncbi:MAG TPA: phosphoglycerate kinase, partial [Actinobacteria bacterium]|nr:phosphoglycerate kinase [Actinomycetota bacterium]